MKQKIKILIPLFLVIVLTILSSIGAFADTIYTHDGYRYTIINNFSVSICGCDNNITDLLIPGEINQRAVVDIGNRAFMNNTAITSVDFSNANNLARIGSFAFRGCSGLSEELVLPASIQTLGTAAFEDCNSITAVTVAGEVTEIPAQCFNRCVALENVTLTDSISSIGNYAFADCESLTYLELSHKVTNIASSAFNGDNNLTLGVWYGTAGYDYAIAQNISYTLLDGVKLGDVSGDGSVNINDVTTVQRYLAELETLEGIYLHAADANQDGTVDIADATVIQMYLAEYEMEYPIGEVMTQ